MKKKRVQAASLESEPPRRRQRFLPAAIGAAGGAILAGAALWLFKKQAGEVAGGKADGRDAAILESIHETDNSRMHAAMEVITQLGSHPATGIAAGLTAIMLHRGGRRAEAWTIVLSAAGAMAAGTILKSVFQRQRPIEMARRIKLPKSHSFPSAHALMSAATYPIVVHHLVRNRSFVAQALVHTLGGMTILSIGFSRVYFGVHFPSDVLGGFAAGAGWLGLTSIVHAVVSREPKARLGSNPATLRSSETKP
ncbi:MAG TPA: phosphatase PAP2 family protein [Thermoanaerobaculia bacterium]|nr:phosphatase PAP2 family protein [Thermoanaerobaculia bacterium]